MTRHVRTAKRQPLEIERPLYLRSEGVVQIPSSPSAVCVDERKVDPAGWMHERGGLTILAVEDGPKDRVT